MASDGDGSSKADQKQRDDESEEENVDLELEPFFFDEAEAVADHERRMQREKAEALKEEQRVRAANAHKFALAKILDYDPKQGGRYYNRYHFEDFSKFDLDEECESIDLSIKLTFHHIYCTARGLAYLPAVKL